MSENNIFKKLDDFVLVHYTSKYGYEEILKTMELRSVAYMGKDSEEHYCNPKKIYTTLYKKSRIKELINLPIYKFSPVFYFDPRMILDYRDKVNFPVGQGFGADDHPYKRFPQEPIEKFKDLWPKNDEEELALNLHNWWNMFEEWLFKEDAMDFPQNELLFETDFIPLTNYLLKVEPGRIKNKKTHRFNKIPAIIFKGY